MANVFDLLGDYATSLLQDEACWADLGTFVLDALEWQPERAAEEILDLLWQFGWHYGSD